MISLLQGSPPGYPVLVREFISLVYGLNKLHEVAIILQVLQGRQHVW